MQEFIEWVGQINTRGLIVVLALVYWIWTFFWERGKYMKVKRRLDRWKNIEPEKKTVEAKVDARYVDKFSMSQKKTLDDNVMIDYKFKAKRQEYKQTVPVKLLPKEFHPEKTRTVYYQESNPEQSLFEVEVEHKDESIAKAKQVFNVDLIAALIIGAIAIVLVFIFF